MPLIRRLKESLAEALAVRDEAMPDIPSMTLDTPAEQALRLVDKLMNGIKVRRDECRVGGGAQASRGLRKTRRVGSQAPAEQALQLVDKLTNCITIRAEQ